MTTLRRALVVEDDADLQTLLRTVLHSAGFEVRMASTASEALESTRAFDPELITLDLNLPDVDGLILCRGLRSITDAYILILTARHDLGELLVGLERGADDYMTKPFSTLELSARAHALLRRPRGVASPGAPEGSETLTYGDLVLETGSRTSRVDGVDLPLTKTEYDVLAALARRPEQLVTRQQLLEQVWGAAWSGGHLVDVHVANLRRKLRTVGGDVEVLTVRGLGYRLHRALSR